MWWSYGRTHTDVDQSLLWLAAHDLGQFHVQQPNFYGQLYDTVFEVLPATLLHGLGVPFPTGVPLATTALATAGWMVLALAAVWDGQPVTGCLALAMPVVMSTGYLILVDAPRGVMAGDFLGCLCAALTILGARRPRLLLLGTGLGALAIQMEAASALVVGPAVVAGLLRCWPVLTDKRTLRSPRTWLSAGLALALPVGWFAWTTTFYRDHQGYNRADSTPLVPHYRVFVEHVRHATRYVALFAPQVWHWAPLVLVVLGAILVWAIASLRLPVVAAALVLVALLLYAPATPKLGQVDTGVYLSGSRLILTLPWAIWLLVHLAVSTRTPRVPVANRSRFPIVVMAIALLAFVTTALRQADLTSQVTSANRGASTHVIRLESVTSLRRSCRPLEQVARTTRVNLVITDDRNLAYGCVALDPRLTSFIPTGDRREWVVRSMQTIDRTGLLMPGDHCATVRKHGYDCSTADAVTVVTFRAQPVIAVLARLHIPLALHQIHG